MNQDSHQRLLLPWSSFNALGRNRVVKSSYVWAVLVPVVAKMLSSISRDYQLPILGLNIRVVLGVPFTWELLYYSSVFFAIATLIYAVFCPEIVKRYDRYSDFSAQRKWSDQLVSYAYGVTGDRTRRSGNHKLSNPQLLRFLKAYVSGKQGISLDDPVFLEYISQVPIHHDYRPESIAIHAGSLDAAFWFLRDCSDRYSWFALLIVQVCYGIGFVLFGWVMAQNFWYVFSHHLFGRG